MQKPTNDIPRWARVLSGEGWWKRRPLPGRAHMVKAAAFIVGLAAVYALVSLFVTPEPMVKLLRYSALFMLVVGCIQYALICVTVACGRWPADDGAEFRQRFFAKRAFGFGKTKS